MTYVVRQKIRGHIYAYEATGTWDPEKKNSTQKRKYIGRVDEQGNIIPKGSGHSSAKIIAAYDFGDLFAVLKIAEGIGLYKILRDIFLDKAKSMLILSANRVIMPGSMNMVDRWLSRTYLEGRMKGQRISELLAHAGDAWREFANRWLLSSGREDATYFDITSMESYSEGNRLLEFGYSRTGRDQKQINMGLIVGRSSRPLFFEIYPGSIPDVKTLIRMLEMLRSHGISCILVLDRGFYSVNNIRALMDFRFLMPLPMRTLSAKEILKTTRMNSKDARMHNGVLLYTKSGTLPLEGMDVGYTLFHDPGRESREKRKFFEKLVKAESDISGIEDMRRVEEVAYPWIKYLRILPGMRVERRGRAIARRLSTMGRMILIGNADLAWDESIDLYRSRDRVEKAFLYMKNDLDSLPMGVHSDETMHGYLLIQFIALIIESEMRRRMRESGLSESMGLREMLVELSKLRVVKQGDFNTLTEISLKQREIFKGLGIEEKDIVIN